MRKNEAEKDILAEAIEQLKKEGLSNPLPQAVADETARRIAESGTGLAPLRPAQSVFRTRASLNFAAAAVVLLVGYLAGRAAAPDMNQIREALTPSIAASLEPALRQKLVAEMRDDYQVALAGTYVRLKEDLTQQYRDDLNRFALQTLAASNATTNALLAELVQSLDTAQAQDQRRIALALAQIEAKRMQDKTQLAAGLQTLAYRTQDEFALTKKVLARFLIDEASQGIELPPRPVPDSPSERNKP
jgi:hypothetical protein